MKNLHQKVYDALSKNWGMTPREVAAKIGISLRYEIHEILEALLADGLVSREKRYLSDREIQQKSLPPTRFDGEKHWRWSYWRN
jgi:predicted transcriptional regulator